IVPEKVVLGIVVGCKPGRVLRESRPSGGAVGQLTVIPLSASGGAVGIKLISQLNTGCRSVGGERSTDTRGPARGIDKALSARRVARRSRWWSGGGRGDVARN